LKEGESSAVNPISNRKLKELLTSKKITRLSKPDEIREALNDRFPHVKASHVFTKMKGVSYDATTLTFMFNIYQEDTITPPRHSKALEYLVYLS